MDSLSERRFHVDDKAMHKLVRPGGLGATQEVVLEVAVPRLHEVVGVNTLKWDLAECDSPLRDAFVPDIADVGAKAELFDGPFVDESYVGVKRDGSVDHIDEVAVHCGGGGGARSLSKNSLAVVFTD